MLLKKMLFVITLLIIASMMLGLSLQDNRYRLVEMKRHHVKANETLWEIAKTVGAASEKDDIREIVEDIRDANEIGPRDYLQEGSIIMVPIYKKK